jgi:quercetin dioxygenase-like cupin family protein
MKRSFFRSTVVALGVYLAAFAAFAQQPLVTKSIAERKVTGLPEGTLFWRIENVDTLANAKAMAGRWSLAAESDGKVWLFTLGPAGGATTGALKVTEVGPIPRIESTEYLLRINEASGPPGAVTAVHSHPGSEVFYVLAGEQTIRSANGVMKIKPGHAEAGQGADKAMQVSSSGSTDLHALVMFVVDATKPFSTPRSLP